MKEGNNKIEKIKSPFILKNILSLISFNKKPELINYNKKLQSKLLIGFEYYKITSYKYKIGERDGKGKEYMKNTDILIFEGE